MLAEVFTLDNALLLGALCIGPLLMLGFVLLMGSAKRRALLRRAPNAWDAGDPALAAAQRIAGFRRVPVDRIRPRDRLVAELFLDHSDVASLIENVENQPAAVKFMGKLHERTVADLGMLLAGIADW
jgi:hypothetical protein